MKFTSLSRRPMPGICYSWDRIGMKENDSKLWLREGELIGVERGGAPFRARHNFTKSITKPVLPALRAVSQTRRRFTMAVLMSDFPNAPEPTPGLWRFARQS